MLGSITAIASGSRSRLKTTLRATPLRSISSTSAISSRASFTKPGPPQLPAKDQKEFDALLKANQSIGASPAAASSAEDLEKLAEQHRDIRRGPKKDFEGEVNPRTGEQGGPKVDPFKAGPGDWQYGGRVTVSASGLTNGLC
jgi:hypothetical protein